MLFSKKNLLNKEILKRLALIWNVVIFTFLIHIFCFGLERISNFKPFTVNMMYVKGTPYHL